MKYLKKTLSFVLAFAMMFTMVIVPKTSVSEAASTDTKYAYFNTTLFNYDADTFNQQTHNLDQNSSKQGIYFNFGQEKTKMGSGYVTNQAHNKWTGNNPAYRYTGIVKETLENGKIVFDCPDAGVFDTDKVVNGKKVYTNVGMPFKVDSNGYYCFDSEDYDVRFPNQSSPQSDVNLVPQTTTTTINNGSNKTAFLPFATGNYYSISDYNANKASAVVKKGSGYNATTIDASSIYFFGMSMSTNFYTTSDGKVKGDSMKFEFSGDDDVWVFVDGKLVLDIGGIHDRINASINFENGNVTYSKGDQTSQTNTTGKNLYTVLDVDKDTWLQDTTTPHTLQVFYLERGAGESNCKIKFNLPQKDTLDVTKSIGNEVNSSDMKNDTLKSLLNQTFKFRISSSSNGKDYAAYANKKYEIYEDGSYAGSGVTNGNGEFTLKFKQTASFAGEETTESVTTLGQSGYFKVEEITGDNAKYVTKWTTSKTVKGITTDYTMKDSDKNTEAVLKVEGKDVTDSPSKYHFTFINTLEPTLNDDVVVLDYGKQVKIDVLANDVLFSSEKLIDKIDASGCTNGKLTISGDNKELIYRPYKYMESVDKATYSVPTSDEITNNTANVSIIPATTVYYEDNFGGTGKDGEEGLAITYTGNWSTVKDDGETIKSIKANTNTDYQDDGTVGNGNQYGYDKSYEGDGKFSNGSSAVVKGTYNSDTKTYDATAEFTFTGTGFDIISRTDTDCGTIHVVVTDANDNIVLKDANGDFYVSNFNVDKYPNKKTISVVNKGTNHLYQIPVISCKGLDHGRYKVLIKVAGPSKTMELGSTFYLDAIRIYDPIKVDNGQDSNNDSTNSGQGAATINKEVVDAYGKDNELDTKVTKIKDIIVQEDGTINGSAFIDTNLAGTTSGTTSDGDTYDNIGPNNEVYLAKGQSITFNINADDQIPVRVYIGAKSANSKTATLAVTSTGSSKKGNRDITSATDMYYDVTDYVKFRTVGGKNVATLVIGNKDKSTSTDSVDLTNVLALTNIKLAYTDKVSITSANNLYSVPKDNTEAIKVAKKLLAKPQKVEETEQPTEEKEANLEIASANFTSSKVSMLKGGTLIVKTSADVKYLGILDSNGKVIQPSSITSKVDESLVGTNNDSTAKTWTVKIKFSKAGNQKIAVYGIGEDGSVSKEVKTISVKVTLFGSIKDMFREW